MKDKLRFIHVGLLVGIFCGYLFSIFAFSHVHIIDGVRIVHSHPFQDGHEERNDHSESELLLYKVLTENFVVEEPLTVYVEKPTSLQIEVAYATLQYSLVVLDHTTLFLRGPPTV